MTSHTEPGGGNPRLTEVSNLELWPLVVYFVAVIALVLTMLGLSWLLGEQRANAATNEPFESGVVSVGNAQGRISVDFYLIAIFFVIFDLETVFIFAWAIAFFELGWQGYFAMLVFVLVLVVALVYEWRSGALEWGVKSRTTAPPSSIPGELERIKPASEVS
ncbi:MAG: NAD(P)H-quinone oxidoreductase subunit 3 [Gammaproteobacteria bacterium]|nr:NAD(P)H-quinone oxidoreductase subunit 3 [Gammaproteobacteria bacterium]